MASAHDLPSSILHGDIAPQTYNSEHAEDLTNGGSPISTPGEERTVPVALALNNGVADIAPSSGGHQAIERTVELQVEFEGEVDKYLFPESNTPQQVYQAVQQTISLDSEFLLIYKGADSHLPKHSNLTLAQWNIKSKPPLIVTTDIDAYLGIHVQEEEDVMTEQHIDQGSDADFHMPIEQLRKDICSSLTTVQQILVRRENIVKDAMSQYMDGSILSCRVYVSFEGENGEDLDGLTREFFSIFWQQFISALAGADRKYFSIDPCNVLSLDEVGAVGRIILHGFILTGYLPTYITPAALFTVFTGRLPSTKYCLDSFISCLDTGDKSLLERAITAESINEETKVNLAAFLGNFGIAVLPSTKECAHQVLSSLAQYILIIKPHYFLHNLNVASNKFAMKIFSATKEEDIANLIMTMVPTGQNVVKILKYQMSEAPYENALEENVRGFLESFLLSASSSEVANFMQFVTGSDLMTDSILVDFNGVSDAESMLLNTCSRSLHLSRFFLTYEFFRSVMKRVFSSVQLWARFDMIWTNKPSAYEHIVTAIVIITIATITYNFITITIIIAIMGFLDTFIWQLQLWPKLKTTIISTAFLGITNRALVLCLFYSLRVCLDKLSNVDFEF